MQDTRLNELNTLARIILGLVFIYHGLIPKILFLDPVEIALMDAHGLNAELFSPIAGALEIGLGLCIIFLKGSLTPIYLGALALVVLLIDVAILKPSLLSGAFNPVTVNSACLALAYIVYRTQDKEAPR